MLQRMVTLSTQAANATINTVAAGNISTEFQALMDEIDRIANYTDFNGTKPLAEANRNPGTMTFQIGPSGGEKINVASQSMKFRDLVGTYDTDGKFTPDTHNVTAESVKNKTSANEALETLNSCINTVSTYRAMLGAAQNRLEHTVNSLKVTSENIQAAESRIRDTNMPDEITSFTKNNILLQAAQSMLSQSNAVPQSVLSLLG